jgi:alpha-L-fucosidase 2
MGQIGRRKMLQLTSLMVVGRSSGLSPLTSLLGAESTASAPHALMLWYKQPAAAWAEALVIGNGRLGGMVWGGMAEERIDLNDDTLWSGEPFDNVNPKGLEALPKIREFLRQGNDKAAQQLVEEDMNGRYYESYEPLGTLSIKLLSLKEGADDPASAQYRRSLDLRTGVASVEFVHGGVRYTREIFASHPADALVVNLRADRPGAISAQISLSSPHHASVRASGDVVQLAGRAPSHVDYHQHFFYDDGPLQRGMRLACQVKAVCEGGSLAARDNTLIAEGCDGLTLLLVTATSFNGPHRSPSADGRDETMVCEQALVKSRGRSYPQLRSHHVADHSALFDRVSLDLGSSDAAQLPTDERLRTYRPQSDPALASLYAQFGRYLLIAASRPGTQPSNLQGIWNNNVTPPWASNYTLNCNAEINYWPVEVANLAECHQPLIELTRELSVDGAHVARDLYGVRGWVAHHNTDIWRLAAPVDGSARWSIFQVGSAWLCQHLWEHYAFSNDLAYLRSVWPMLRDAARFYLDNLMLEPAHGWLVTGPDTNFENAFRKPDGSTGVVCMGPTGSMQMVRQLFLNVAEASRLLGLDSELRTEVEQALPKLAPMQISPTTGELQEWLEDWQRTAQGQVLSSWGAICSAQITPRGTPELAAALKKTFDNGHWWQQGRVGSWQGAFQANVYARFYEGDTAAAVLDTHLARSVNPNLTARAGRVDWQIDGNLGLTAAVFEMLLQSHAGEIHLLPALPAAWPNGSVQGLRARNGFEVDMRWQSSRLQQVRIASSSGTPMPVRYRDMVFPLTLPAGQSLTLDGDLKPLA